MSVVSSRDENARKEYIHPRVTIMRALGRDSCVPEPLVIVTEMVALFIVEGLSVIDEPERAKLKKGGEFFG